MSVFQKRQYQYGSVYVVPLTAFVPETQEYLDYCHPYEPKLTKIK